MLSDRFVNASHAIQCRLHHALDLRGAILQDLQDSLIEWLSLLLRFVYLPFRLGELLLRLVVKLLLLNHQCSHLEVDGLRVVRDNALQELFHRRRSMWPEKRVKKLRHPRHPRPHRALNCTRAKGLSGARRLCVKAEQMQGARQIVTPNTRASCHAHQKACHR